ncbi:MAG TPA: hypothetical protein VIQ24_04920 [Pyrinomonadaceae bacterium]
MFRFKFKMPAAIITFTIGVALASAAASVWKISSVETEKPPCQSCSALYSSAEIPVVTICELKANPENFMNRVVRVRAVLHHDAGQVNLYDHTCGNDGVHAGLSNSFESCVGVRKALSIYSGFGTWYDSNANVVVVGSVGRLDNPTLFDDGKAGFNIVCLERAEPIGSGMSERIKYTVGELFRLNSH